MGMKRQIYRLMAGALAAAMFCLPAMAVEEEAAVQQPSPWAYEALADSYALGMLDDNYATYIQSAVTMEQVEHLTGIVADKLALLYLPEAEAGIEPLVVDTTRGGVMNALYQEAAAYKLPGVEEGAESFLVSLNVVRGDGTGLAAERDCTYQEAMVMAQRLVLAVYDLNDAGSKGLLWKAVNGENTLYLLGTIHADRSNVYPFHSSLRDAILAADKVIFELDFNDTAGIEAFAAMQTYSDGTGLKDHISPELYAETVELFGKLGMSEEQVNAYKPWPLMLTLNNMLTADESTSGNAMAIDVYVNSKAVNHGAAIDAVETYVFQGKIFDTLSPEYQEEGLASGIALVKAAMGDGEQSLSEEEQMELEEALAIQQQTLDAMMEAWKNRDAAAFEASYNKAAIVESDDEMNARLFTDRDPNMIQAAAAYLETEGENTFFMAAGAGHMVDPGGIVSGLRDLGYTVELVE